MRVLILADEIFASRERSLLVRLEIGLADDGVQIAHAIPARAASSVQELGSGSVYARALTYEDAPAPFASARRAKRLIEQLLEEDGFGRPDVIHAFGGRTWPLAVELAERLESALALEVWRAGLIPRARSVKAEDAAGLVFLAPDPALERALRDAGGDTTIRSALWGVHPPASARRVLPEGEAVSLMMIGGGRSEADFIAAFEGAAGLLESHPGTILFVDASAATRAGLWSHARKLGVLEQVSLIEELEGRRDLLLHGDILIYPEARGEHRSVILDAMASGMLLLAAADPMISALQDGLTARLVSDRSAGAWREGLASLLDDRPGARRLAASALQFVREHRRAIDHVRAVQSAYAWMISKDSIRLGGA